MKKEKIIVPKGIRYLGEWKEFRLPDEVCIIDKQITGCGFTEFCLSLSNPENVILVSPRKILLENKEEQHKGDVFYANSGLDQIIDFEKDFTGHTFTKVAKEVYKTIDEEEAIKGRLKDFKDEIANYFARCHSDLERKPCKILVTYDSFRHVKEALGEYLEDFHVVVDEFQSILVDAKFKSSTEIEFLSFLQDLPRVAFVSATPMIDKYLEMLDEFKDLPFYELDWGFEEPSRITKPELKIKEYDKSMYEHISDVICRYKEGKFESRFREIDGRVEEIQSKEAVFFVNSVKALCSIIKKNNLTLENTNVLCARNTNNEKEIRAAFKESYKKLYPEDKSKQRIQKDVSVIGKVPLKGELHKMFTLCTRTVYLGADFYSTNARTFIFSDANVDSLTVDVSMDLEQILGRQRLDENPWKNTATLYIKLQTSKMTREDFEKELERKKLKTENLLSAYSTCIDTAKHDLAEKYQKDAKASNYKDDYVAVNEHAGSDLKPVSNNLMMVADQRTFEIQQVDYKDRFTIFNALGGDAKFEYIRSEFDSLVETFESRPTFISKMKFVEAESVLMTEDKFKQFLTYLPNEFINYITVLGFDEIKSCGYQRSKIIKRLSNKSTTKESQNKVSEDILSSFVIGGKYSNSYIKEKLKTIYDTNEYTVKSPKASNLKEIFNVKPCKIQKPDTTWENGLEILGVK
jgi:hypothetical protein